MKEVIAIIQPFAMRQVIYVFDGLSQTNVEGVTLADLPERLIQLCEENEAEELHLRGDIHFTSKIANIVKDKGLSHYSENGLTIFTD